jgi:flagellar hook-length control protein FliK
MEEVALLTTPITLPADSATTANSGTTSNSGTLTLLATDTAASPPPSPSIPAAETGEAEKPATPVNRLPLGLAETESVLGDSFSRATRQLSDMRTSKGYAGLTATDSETGTTTGTLTLTDRETGSAGILTLLESRVDRGTLRQVGEEEEIVTGTGGEMNAALLPRTDVSESLGRVLDRPDVTATSPARQIETEILKNLEGQKMEFRMQLQPAELGKVDVRMVLESGKLLVEIVSTARTNDILARQVESLAAALRLNNPELSSVQVVAETAQSGTAYLESALNGGDAYAGGQNGEGQQGTQAGSQWQSETEETDSTAPVILEHSGSRALDYTI